MGKLTHTILTAFYTPIPLPPPQDMSPTLSQMARKMTTLIIKEIKA